jgi:hypothetical protein
MPEPQRSTQSSQRTGNSSGARSSPPNSGTPTSDNSSVKSEEGHSVAAVTIVLGIGLLLLAILPRDTELELKIAGIAIKSVAAVVDLSTVVVSVLMARLAWIMAEAAHIAASEGATLSVQLSTDAEKDVAHIERPEETSINPMLAPGTARPGVLAVLYWFARGFEGWIVYLFMVSLLIASLFAVVHGAWVIWKQPSLSASGSVGVLGVLAITTFLTLCSLAQYWMLRRRGFKILELPSLAIRNLPARFSLTDFVARTVSVTILLPLAFAVLPVWRRYIGPFIRRHRPSTRKAAMRVLRKREPDQLPWEETFVVLAVQFARVKCEVTKLSTWQSQKTGAPLEVGHVFTRIEVVAVDVASCIGESLYCGHIGPAVFSDDALRASLVDNLEGIDSAALEKLARDRKETLVQIAKTIVQPAVVLTWNDGGLFDDIRALKVGFLDVAGAPGFQELGSRHVGAISGLYGPVLEAWNVFEVFGLKEPTWGAGTSPHVKTKSVLESLTKLVGTRKLQKPASAIERNS